jgi:hypothetical protein
MISTAPPQWWKQPTARCDVGQRFRSKTSSGPTKQPLKIPIPCALFFENFVLFKFYILFPNFGTWKGQPELQIVGAAEISHQL